MIRKALGTTPRRRLPRLLRRVQAARGPGRPRADHAVGARPLPPALLAMCGIVGLFAKHPDVEERLGAHLGAMLAQMADRGPDSAGVALYREPAPLGATKLSVYEDGRHEVVIADGDAAEAVARLREERPGARVMSAGTRIEIIKEVGDPRGVRRALRPRRDVGLARARAHADGDREQGHDRGRAPVLHRAGPLPRPQRLALQPQRAAAAAAARGDRVPDRERHRGRRRLPGVAAARGRHAAGGARGVPGRPRRLLHVRGRDGGRLRGAARPDRLQARGDGRERRLGGDGVGVPRDRRAAGRRRRRGVGARAGPRLLVGAAATAKRRRWRGLQPRQVSDGRRRRDRVGRPRRDAAARAQPAAARAGRRAALARRASRTARTPSRSGSTPRSRSTSTATSATTAPA